LRLHRWEFFYTLAENFIYMVKGLPKFVDKWGQQDNDNQKEVFTSPLQVQMLREILFYNNEPLLEYVTDVSNYFWPLRAVFDYDKIDMDNYSIFPSRNPSTFAKRYHENQISNFRLDKYIEAVRETAHFRHSSYFDSYHTNFAIINAPQRRKSYSGEIAGTLIAYNLDISKFWYLCLMIKDYVEGQTAKGCILLDTTHREEISQLISLLNILSPKEESNKISTSEDVDIELIINVKNKKSKMQRHIPISANGQTLTLIKNALQAFLNKNPDECFLLDSPVVNWKRLKCLRADKSLPVKLALFYRYLSWFLNRQNINEEYVKENQYFISTSKNLLISRMAYFTGLTNSDKFLKGDANYLRTYISGKEDVEVNTINKYYDVPDEDQYIMKYIQTHANLIPTK